MPEWEWIRPLFAEPLDVDWRNVGGDWERHLSATVRELTGGNIQSSRYSAHPEDDARAWLEFRVAKEPVVLSSAIRVTPIEPQGIRVDILGHGVQDESELELWREAVRRATNQSPRDEVEFAWIAILGARGWPLHLTAGGRVGSVAITPDIPDERIVRVSNDVFEPIHISGVVTGFSWFTARLDARRHARMIAAILSVAWGDLIDVFVEPSAPQQGEGQPDLRSEVAWTRSQATSVCVPSWAEAISMPKHPQLQAALLVHHEGLQLRNDGHPSFAFAAFVASLEAVGAMTVPLGEKCPECKTRKGAMERFRSALGMVFDVQSPEFKFLKNTYGEYRSSTVHTGDLHGAEEGSKAYYASGNPFLVRPDERFVWRELSRIRDASRRVLLQLLSSPGTD